MKKLILLAVAAVAPIVGTASNYYFNAPNSLNSLAHGSASTWGLSNSSGVKINNTTSSSVYSSLLNELAQSGKTITGATLTLCDPRDWQAERRDVLYVNILKGINAGAATYAYATQSNTPDTVYGTNAFLDASGTKNNKAHTGLTFVDADPTKSLLRALDTTMPTNTIAGTNGFSTADRNALPGTWTDAEGPYGQSLTPAQLLQISDLSIAFSGNNLALLEQYLRLDFSSPSSNPTVGLGFAAECHYYFSDIKLSISVGPRSVPEASNTIVLLGVALLSVVALRRRLS